MTPMAFLFPGQGSQEVGMGKTFYDHSSWAKDVFDRADEVLGYEISRLCFEGPAEELKLTQNTQPALLIVSYIAFTLLGKIPHVAAGHSLGEYSALVAAGALTFEDALLLVHKRGKYMQEAVPVGVGTMAAVLGSDIEDIRRALHEVKTGSAEVANWNTRDQVVIAGHKEAVEEALESIKPPKSVMLPVSAPFHTTLMMSAEERLSADLDRVLFKDLKFPVVTNVDAKAIHRAEEARDSLKRQVSRPVLWYKSMEQLEREDIGFFVELGPGKVLSGMIRKISRNWAVPPAVLNVENWETLEKAQEALLKVP